MRKILTLFSVSLLFYSNAFAVDITYEDKVSGGEFTAVNANEIKAAVNSKADQTDLDTTDAAVALNTAKVVITNQQANDIITNLAKVGITAQQAANIIINLEKVGITTAQVNAIIANTAKVGITTQQAANIVTNLAKVGITTQQAANIVTNLAKVGITTAQADAIIANTAKDSNVTQVLSIDGQQLTLSGSGGTITIPTSSGGSDLAVQEEGTELDDAVTVLNFIGAGITAVENADHTIDITVAAGSAPIDTVNGQTGTVVLEADDIDDTSTANKFTTAADISKLSAIEAGATADQDLSNLLTTAHTTMHPAPTVRDARNQAVLVDPVVLADTTLWDKNVSDDFDGAYSSLSGQPTIPTNNNELTNGASYLTQVAANAFYSLVGHNHSGVYEPAGITVSDISDAGTAISRAAEDTLTNGSNLPDGAAIITYGNANWGGGSTFDLTAEHTFTALQTFTGGISTGPISFEGATADEYETTFSITDPTADRTLTLGDYDMQVPASAYISSTGQILIAGLSGTIAADTATILETARTIGGVSFNGSANINLPGVNISGTQDTTGNAATSTLAANATLFDTHAASYFQVALTNPLVLGGSYTPTGTWNWQTATATWPTFNQSTTGQAGTGDSATAFFSTGTIEAARLPATVPTTPASMEIFVLDDCSTATGMSTGDLCFEY